MPRQIGDLPDEVLVICLSFLPKADLKSARLTCAHWGRIGAERLFDRVFFAPRKEILEYFKRVSDNPVFSKNITELVYDARLFRKHKLSYQAFKNFYDSVEEDKQDLEESDRGAWSEHNNQNELYRARVSQSLLQYTLAFYQQNYILEGSHDYILCDGLKRMPNIKRVTILDGFSDLDLVPQGSETYSWYNHKSTSGRGPALQPSGWANDAEEENDLLYKYDWDCRGLINLFQAVSTTHLGIKELYIGSDLSSAPLLIFTSSPTAVIHLHHVMRYLTTLSIGCDLKHSRRGNIAKNMASLLNALAETKDLIFLSINIGQDQSLMKQVYLKPTWSNLKRLDIANAALLPEDLSTFAQAHTDTLRIINFRKVHIDGEGWEQVGAQLGQILKLERVTLFKSTNVGYRGWWLSNDYCSKITNLLLQWVPPQRRLLKTENGLHVAMVLPELQLPSPDGSC